MIYIVTQGYYSEYEIKAVFTDKQLALNYVARCDGTIEEWEENAKSSFVLRKHFQAVIAIGTGDVRMFEYDEENSVTVRSLPADVLFTNGKPSDIRVVSLIDKDHALKLAAEARQKYLREQGMK